MWSGLDHRKFPRLVVACDVFVKGEGNGYTLSTVTTNVSRGGICVMLGKALRKFEQVSVKLELDEERPIECLGKVAWSIPAKVFRRQTNTFDTGIEFVNLSQADSKKIEQFIVQSLAKQAKQDRAFG